MRRSALGVIAVAAAAVISCGLVTGVGDLKEVTALAPDGGVDLDVMSAGDAAVGSDALADTVLADIAASDAALDVVSEGACVPSGPEDCTDGKDNDCDGLTDCADPACAAFECVPAAPPGFTLVGLAQGARPACPTGYVGPSDLLVDPSLGPFTCTCACGVGGAPSCTTGTLALKDACTGLLNLAANGGACGNHSFTDTTHSLEPLGPTGGSCVAASQAIPPPAGTNGRSCAPLGSGAGCSAGDVCVARPAAPYAVCIANPAAASCPSAYPTTHAAGTGLASDTRGCASCGACAAPTATCTNASMIFYKDPLCSGLLGTLPADGACDPTNWSAFAYRYSATVTSVACAAPTAGTPAGSATLASPETLCCP